MKKFVLPAVMIALLALVACGKSEGGGPTATTSTGSGGGGGNVVEMAGANFVQQSVSVHAGQAVIFRDPQATGAYHILCLGLDQSCKSNPQGPSELNTSSGITFNAGDPDKSIIFPNTGTFTVTCTIHPSMLLTVTVQ